MHSDQVSRCFVCRRLSTHEGSLLGQCPWMGISIGLLLMLAATMAGQTAAQPPTRRYQVIELPLKPWHLSNSGQVAGKTSRNRAATWTRRRGLQLLPVPKASSESEARGSNVSDYVVGFATGNDQVSAFTYKNGKLVLLPGKNSKAFAINDSDDVVGESEVGGKPPVTPVLWKNGRLTSLGGCCGGVAKGINNHGQIVGDLYDQAGRYRAFLWDKTHGIQSIGPTAGTVPQSRSMTPVMFCCRN